MLLKLLIDSKAYYIYNPISMQARSAQEFWNLVKYLACIKYSTLEIFYDAAGLTSWRMRNLKHRDHFPSMNEICTIADALDVSLEYLLIVPQKQQDSRKKIADMVMRMSPDNPALKQIESIVLALAPELREKR